MVLLMVLLVLIVMLLPRLMLTSCSQTLPNTLSVQSASDGQAAMAVHAGIAVLLLGCWATNNLGAEEKTKKN